MHQRDIKSRKIKETQQCQKGPKKKVNKLAQARACALVCFPFISDASEISPVPLAVCVCVCVCVCEREREREREDVCIYVWMCVCMLVSE